MLAGLFIACQSKNKFIVEGNFIKDDPTPVELYLLQEEHSVRIDSVFSDGTSFTLKGQSYHPSIYMLKFFNDQYIYLIVHAHDHIILSIDNTMSEVSYYVENSQDSKYIKELTDQQNKVLRQIDQLSIDWKENMADTLRRKMIDSAYFALMQEHRQFSRHFIQDHPGSLANILAIYQNFGRKGTPLFDKYDDLDVFNFVDSMLSPLYPETEAVIALNRSVSEIKYQIQEKTLIEKKVEVGFPMPKAALKSIGGDSIIIGGAENKPVILIFWASWNPYSIEEIHSLQEIFRHYESINKPEIISISLDSSEEKLLQCIKEQKIVLPVICDYQYWDSNLAAKYVVKRIPTIILADKKGRVIARDIDTGELSTLINEIL